jgi:NAD(P) transhydrogenase subunit beta
MAPSSNTRSTRAPGGRRPASKSGAQRSTASTSSSSRSGGSRRGAVVSTPKSGTRGGSRAVTPPPERTSGAFGAVDEVAAGDGPQGSVRSASTDEAGDLLKNARSVVIVPGYGMAVAQAQHKVRELADALEKEGVDVRFAIHPVAGRMPGHMNVLLAEANVPYEQLLDMDEINDDFPQVDVVLVLGANDVVNPAARHNASSPIYGMPILNVDQAGCVMVVKRGMSAGFAGIENELFFNEKTLMVFGDAKSVVGELVTEVTGQRDAISL